jgi:hypothetical protein
MSGSLAFVFQVDMCRIRYYYAKICNHVVKITAIHDCERTATCNPTQTESVVHSSRDYCDHCLRAINTVQAYTVT